MMSARLAGVVLAASCTVWVACGQSSSTCGPTSAVVVNVVDGDTVDLDSGERVRYLMVDTPELSGGAECYGIEARDFNRDLVLGVEVRLEYDVECTDRFGRLLAYVYVGDREINRLLIERGFGCVLYIPPNGEDRRTEFETLEAIAEGSATGMWGECQEVPCAN